LESHEIHARLGGVPFACESIDVSVSKTKPKRQCSENHDMTIRGSVVFCLCFNDALRELFLTTCSFFPLSLGCPTASKMSFPAARTDILFASSGSEHRLYTTANAAEQ
jgi:hypothetical protein